jgi:ferrous iron transport protein A
MRHSSGTVCQTVLPGKDDWIMPTLDQLKVGQQASIEAIRGNDTIVQRLLEMGLLEGVPIEVIGIAPLGDPIEIRLPDYRLSLRRNEAARITVSLKP